MKTKSLHTKNHTARTTRAMKRIHSVSDTQTLKQSGCAAFLDDFLYCGMLGWLTEIIFTAFNTLKRRDYSLRGITSLWMFPIYGLSACLYPISAFLKKHRVKTSARGLLYTLCIFSIEFISGSMLSKRKRCPWNYYRSPYHVRGVIRLDYAPCWFGFSLIMEKLLWKRHAAEETRS